MAKFRNYVPVSCDFIDHIELFAIKGNPVSIVFVNKKGETECIKETISTWVNQKGVEYLITTKNNKIQMDKIIQIEDVKLIRK